MPLTNVNNISVILRVSFVVWRNESYRRNPSSCQKLPT